MDTRLTVAAVARRLGIAPATLRTWDRRYGLGPSDHHVGSHRRYSLADLGKLIFMKRLITSGVAPVHAAAQAKLHESVLEEGSSDVPESRLAHQKIIHDSIKNGLSQDLIDSLFRAAFALDSHYLELTVDTYIKKFGAIATWEGILVPLLERIGTNWEETKKGVAVEHLLSESIKHSFYSPDLILGQMQRPVLLAAVHEEQHCLALYALKAALHEKGIAAHFLGARTPVDAIVEIIKRVAPPAVFLWALMPENANPAFLKSLPAVRPAPRIIIGGSGWEPNKCEGVVFAPDLASACEQIEQALGA